MGGIWIVWVADFGLHFIYFKKIISMFIRQVYIFEINTAYVYF